MGDPANFPLPPTPKPTLFKTWEGCGGRNSPLGLPSFDKWTRKRAVLLSPKKGGSPPLLHFFLEKFTGDPYPQFQTCSNMSDGINDSEEIASSNLAISKVSFSTEGIGPLDSDVPVVDEIQAFCNLVLESIAYSKKKNNANSLFVQILQFYALLAYEANSLAGDMKGADLALRMTAVYQGMALNLHLKEEYLEVFFRKWPNGKLLDAYMNWVDSKFIPHAVDQRFLVRL